MPLYLNDTFGLNPRGAAGMANGVMADVCCFP